MAPGDFWFDWGVAGTLLGSFFADRYGWPSIFFLNVPFGLLALPAAIVLLPPAQKSRDVVALDLPGALLSTCSLVLLITGLTQIVHPSVNYLLLLACFGGFLIFFLLFCFIEAHVKYPLVPLHFFRQPNVAGSTMVTLAFCATANTVLFFFTLYMQQVHGFSSFITGLAFLPTNVMLILGSFGAPLLIKRWGYKLTILIGLLFLAGGALLYARISVTGEYVWTLLPGLAAVGTGLGICQVAATGVGTHQVGPTERGLVSSLLNVASQVGTALGLAVLVSVANARTLMLAHNSRPSPEDLVAGFQWAFYAGAAFSLLGIVLLFLTIKRRQA
ncbi:MFS transporter [Ktedonosporobacter rubrisoli]|uniref:MFS transporter n=1 Tax=Ktedonosporobacter rubrisoli TaxID=2509675 RepID=UPI0013EEAA44|nr:MFS transporter [Ktedonosporobacter rubrisoli]